MYYMNSELTALAIIPGIALLVYIYMKDRVEKEPLGLIAIIFACGVASTFFALIGEQFLSSVLPSFPQGSVPYALTTAFCIAAFCEEIVKYIAMRIPTWRSRHFNYRYDGIVYGVCSALGFAVYENIRYVAMLGIQAAMSRMFTAVPLHAFCGVFMGVFYAYSKKADILGMKSTKASCTALALLVPMMIHGIYDALAMTYSEIAYTLFYVFVAFIWVVSIWTVRKMSAEDHLAGFYPEPRTIEYDPRFK